LLLYRSGDYRKGKRSGYPLFGRPRNPITSGLLVFRLSYISPLSAKTIPDIIGMERGSICSRMDFSVCAPLHGPRSRYLLRNSGGESGLYGRSSLGRLVLSSSQHTSGRRLANAPQAAAPVAADHYLTSPTGKHRKDALNKKNRIAENPRQKNRRTTSRPPYACARRRIGPLLPVSRGQLDDTAISEVRRFSMMSGSSGRPRSHWVNRPSIRPAAMLAV
jgi:hypothetical protein